MRDLQTQLHEYVESTIERVDVEDVVAAVSAGRIDDPRPVRRLRPVWVAVGAAVLVLLLVGVPLLFFMSGGSPTVDEPTTTTVPASTTVPPTTQPVPTRATPSLPSLGALDMPLSDAVPGFTDTIVMFTTPIAHYVHRWDPSEPATEVILSRGGYGSTGGLDASGRWLAEIPPRGGPLTIHPVPVIAGASLEPESFASDVRSAMWHDTDPGRLAFLACPEPPSETAALFTLDITDRNAEPVPVRSFELGCEVGDTFVDGWKAGDVMFDRWVGNRLVVGVFNGDTFEPALIGADGSEIPIESDNTMVPEGPDGQHLDVEAAIGDDEELRDTSWSPDGAHIALKVWVPSSDDPNRSVRVLDAVSGDTVTEIPERGSGLLVTAMEWSSDGRFLLYHSWDLPADGMWDDTGSAALGFYDTATNTTTLIPLTEFVDEIRIP